MATPSAIAWDLAGVDIDVYGDEWVTIIGNLVWDLASLSEWTPGQPIYRPAKAGIYLCDPSFKLKYLSGVEGVEIGVFKGDDLFFVVASKENIEADDRSVMVQNACTLDFYPGDEVTIRIRLKGMSKMRATISAENGSGIDGDDLNDFTAWGFTLIQEIPGY